MPSDFDGFPEDALEFLRKLKRNNRRDWFLARKDVYSTKVREPMETLILAIGERFRSMAPEMIANPKASLYRIYRDTRFSPDKTPYKTHVAAVFPRRGLGKHRGAGFYVHIDPDEVFAGGGLYMPDRGDLNAIREHIASQHREFRRKLASPRFGRMFGELTGERLVRVPRGFSPEHPAADLLRHKQFLASRQLDPELVTTPAFLDSVIETFRALLPIIRFLNAPILEKHAQVDPIAEEFPL